MRNIAALPTSQESPLDAKLIAPLAALENLTSHDDVLKSPSRVDDKANSDTSRSSSHVIVNVDIEKSRFLGPPVVRRRNNR